MLCDSSSKLLILAGNQFRSAECFRTAYAGSFYAPKYFGSKAYWYKEVDSGQNRKIKVASEDTVTMMSSGVSEK